MNYGQAFTKLAAGCGIAREAWNRPILWLIYSDDQTTLQMVYSDGRKSEKYTPTIEDRLATDWYIMLD